MTTEIEKLPRLIQRATDALEKATSAAEVLEAHDLASVGYSTAKKMAQLARAKGAHDTVLVACRKTMADLLVIGARAKCRLADEYDAAQERGEVAGKGFKGNQWSVPNKNGPPATNDIGLTRKQVHEARVVRDAEKKQPGIVRKTVEERLLTNEEPTHADVKRAVKNVARAKTEDTRPKGSPRARSSKPPEVQSRHEKIVTLADAGMATREIATEVGVGQRMVDRVLEVENARREAIPEIDPATLSISAQQKFEVAIRQYKHKLEAEFYQRVNERVQAFLMDTILPKHRKEQEEAKKISNARRGVMDKETFNKVRRALHPDSRNSISDKKLGEAFDEFMALEKRLLDEKDSPTEFQTLPKTWEDWQRMKREATAARKAKYAASRTAVKSR